ncbi:YbjQ family protein [Piscibacillus sp. B03]|uniref:YbjQ family protein n=1 Tax=Piscibacillus sp. B03 TaxID=3457430 RepID=UPI003FCC8CFE
MIVTTTNHVEGREIEEYVDLVTGQTIMGANVVRDFMASITDVVGGRSAQYENKLNQGKEIAIKEMKKEAADRGANAIVGIDLDFETLRDGMMMIVASGTAVKLK